MSSMTLEELERKALRVKLLYDVINDKAGNKRWNATDFMSGFVGGVGDLTKLIMAKQGLRRIDDTDEKLAHELADCLWCVLVLSRELNVDLSAAFSKTMDELVEDLEVKAAK